MMASNGIRWAVYILIMACLLASCTDNGSEVATRSTPSPESSPTMKGAQNFIQPESARTAEINFAESIQIGESGIGVVYEWLNKLFVKDQEGPLKEIGDPKVEKFSASLSADGSRLLYNRSKKAVAPDQVVCDLTLLDLESGQETNISQNNQVEPCHSFGWLGNLIYVQWNSFPSEYPGLTYFTVFDGETGTLLESGRLYQYLDEHQTRIVLLHPTVPYGEGEGLGSSIRIAALTGDGAFHVLYDQEAYEVQFLDIQVSEPLGAMSVWTHQVPTNTSQLWVAHVDTDRWSAGEWAAEEIKPNPDGGTISFEQGGFVVLSDGRRFELP